MHGITYKQNGKWHYRIDENIEHGKRKRTVRVIDVLTKDEAEKELQDSISALKNKKK